MANESKIPIVVALIGLAGVISAALIGNWDKIVDHHRVLSPAPASSPVANSAEPQGEPVVVFANGNTVEVQNAPARKTTSTISQPQLITEVRNYHWNFGRGAFPQTIGFQDNVGKKYGPWETRGASGQGEVKDASWICNPNIRLPAGTYTVLDGDPDTWSWNERSKRMGISTIKGYPKK